jgi:Asp-tRNA(Asn)/Glu-tRNA(Gln) amidotransferase A subunit family amidase
MRAVLAVAAPRLRTGASRSFVARRIVLQCPARLGKWPTVCADVRGALRAAFDAELGTESLPSPEEARRAFAAMWASHFEDVLSWEPSIDLRRGLSGVVSAIVLRGALGDRAFHPTTAELVALIALGRVTLFRDRASAVRAAKGVADGFRAAWDKGYIVASPVCTVPAPRIGRANRNLDLLTCTVAGNLADATAIAIPAGAFPGGMPRAIQLMGPPGSEEEILSVAERVVGHFADAGINTNVSR